MPDSALLDRVRTRLPAAVGFGIPFLLIVFLSLEAGGYDLVVRSQLGIIVWWLVLLGAIAGLLPVTRVTRAGWFAIGAIALLGIWTLLGSFAWSDSAERGMIEVGRVAALAGFLTALIFIQGRDGIRHAVCAVGAAVALISIVALASRFLPDLIGSAELPANYPSSRLSHPLEYWNGLAALMAMGLAPLLWIATSARSVVGRSAGAAAIPLVALTIYLTASRGGAFEAAISLAVLLAVFPRRLNLLLAAVAPALGSALLLFLMDQRPELRDGLTGGLANSQGDEMTWIAIGVCLAVAAGQAVIARAERRGFLRVPEVSRAAARRTGVALAVVAALGIVVAFGSGFVGDRWSEFKDPAERDATVGRLANLNSEERYLGWQSALDASASERLTGIGPGTFEFWWAADPEGGAFIRDAHSIYLEALAELGPVGMLLVLILILGPIAYGGRLALLRGSDERRSLLAAAVAGMVAFALAAGIDWAWELTVLPLAFFVLVAGALGPSAESRRGRARSRFHSVRSGWLARTSIASGAAIAIVAIALPLAGTTLLRSSQDLAAEGDLPGALGKADDALAVQPYSASADVQRALLLLEMGDRTGARRAALDAVESEPVNWRNWYVLGQVSSSPRQRESAWAEALRLNPKSDFLAGLKEG